MKARHPFVVGIALLAIGAGAYAQQPVKVSAKYLQKPVAFDVPALRGTTNVPLFFLAGEYTSRGGGIYDGARTVTSGMVDVHADRMVIQGVARGEKTGSTFLNRWSGHCINGKADGNAVLMCGGDWYSLPAGTGLYAGIVASGTWKGVLTPEGNFDGEWDGMYTK